MKAPMRRGSRYRAARKSDGDQTAAATLFDLGFLEVDVLANARIVFLHDHFLGLRARILLGHIEETRVGAADELDLDGCRLGHRSVPNLTKKKSGLPPPVRRALIGGARFVKFSETIPTLVSVFQRPLKNSRSARDEVDRNQLLIQIDEEAIKIQR